MPKTPRRGLDALDYKIAELVEDKPWLTNAQLAKEVHKDPETVRDRRARKEWREMYDARHAPTKARWKNDLKPALRRRLAMIATSRNDTAAIQLAERIMPEEVRPVPEARQDERDLAFVALARSVAAWVSRERPGPPDRRGKEAGKARSARGTPAARH